MTKTTDKYILEGKKIVPCYSLEEWARRFEHDKRQIGKDVIGDVNISTVFLGLDHSYGGGKPLLFETMIFGGKFNEEQERYSTYEEAEEGHQRWVKKIKEDS